MESTFGHQPPSKLLNDIIAGLRTRYAYLNDIPRAPMLNSPTGGNAAGDAFYARVVRRVGAWHDSPIVLDKILAEMQERPDFYQEMTRQEIRCNCSTCRDVH
jgi:hypothetical protein